MEPDLCIEIFLEVMWKVDLGVENRVAARETREEGERFVNLHGKTKEMGQERGPLPRKLGSPWAGQPPGACGLTPRQPGRGSRNEADPVSCGGGGRSWQRAE